MGRKNRKQKEQATRTGTPPENKDLVMSKAAKKETMELVLQLLEKCSQPSVPGPSEWPEFVEVHSLLDRIQTVQSGFSMPTAQREEKFTAFMDWIASSGVDIQAVEIANFADCGYGLQAKKDFAEADMFLSVPRKLMMTTVSAKASPLGALVEEDKILQVMPSVVLALHILCEKKMENSFWKPYIDILPERYCTPLYFSQEDVQRLKGSPAMSDCMSQARNIARQYAYFYKLFQTNPSASKIPLKDCFTYADYRWAVSTVMTRQNQIPSPDGSKVTFALIPLWDMCNHCNGYITTDYNLEKDCSECYALRNFTTSDQIYIFYGARSNAELLVNNGFVYPDNQHDRLALKLGISKDDPLFTLKSELLSSLGLQPSRTFYLHTGSSPVDQDLLAFLRIFSMNEEFLKERFSGPDAKEERQQLKEIDSVTSFEVDQKSWSFLETRVALLLRSYSSTIQEDEEKLSSADLSSHNRLTVQLCLCEKQILQRTADLCAKKKQALVAKED